MNKTEMQQFVRKVRGIDSAVLDAVRVIRDFQYVEHELAPDQTPTSVQNIAHAFVLLHSMDPTVAAKAAAILTPATKRAPRKPKAVETPSAPPAPPAPATTVTEMRQTPREQIAEVTEDWVQYCRYEMNETVKHIGKIWECVTTHEATDEFDTLLWRYVCDIHPTPHQTQPPNATVLPDGGVVTPAPVVSAETVYAGVQKQMLE